MPFQIIKYFILIKKYFTTFSWLLFDNIIKIIIGLIISIYTTKYLGPERYGTLSYCSGIVGIISPLTTLGIDSILLRNLIQDQQKVNILISSSKLIKLISSIIFFILTISILYFIDKDEKVIIITSILFIGLNFDSQNIYKELFTAREEMKNIAISSIISILLTNFFRIVGIIKEFDIYFFAIMISLTQIINLIISYFLSFKYSLNLKIKNISLGLIKEMLTDSFPLIFTSLFGTMLIYSDQLIIEKILGFKAVGIYSLAVKLILYLIFIPSIISNIFYPKIIKLKSKDINVFYIKIKKLYTLLFYTAILLTLIINFTADFFIENFLGNEFNDSILILKIYSFSLPFLFINPLSNRILMIDNLQNLILLRNLIGLLVNILLNIYLINIYGLIGAVISTILTQLVVLISYYFSNSTLNIFKLQINAILYPYHYLVNFLRIN